MVRSAVRVVLRARPSTSGNTTLVFAPDRKGVTLTAGKLVEGRPHPSTEKNSYQFKFDSVLNDCSQDDVYEACAVEVLQRAMEGYNGTILCYGQTGAGKTYTMSGGKQGFKQRGLVPRILGQLFGDLRAIKDRDCKVSIQYLEIYNEQLFDLLDISTQPSEINLYENSAGIVTVDGLRSVPVASEAAAMQLLFQGETNRVIGEHQLNRDSSRSHSIFTITLEMRSGEGGDMMVSKVQLVDLAGSERVSKTKSEGLVLREAGYINKSLSILEQVCLGLSDKGRDHVPFRSSKLTHVLKNSLGGNCHTVMVANVWSDETQAEDTLSTCRFAQRMMRIQCEAVANVVTDTSARAKQLERQVAELQQELAMHDAMANRSGTQYGPYSAEQRLDLRPKVSDFLNAPMTGPYDSLEPLDLNSLRHVREVLYMARALFREARGNAPSHTGHTSYSNGPVGVATPPPLSSAVAAAAARLGRASSQKAATNGSDESAGVGYANDSSYAQTGGVGVAPDYARPRTNDGEEGEAHAASASGRPSSKGVQGSNGQGQVGGRPGSRAGFVGVEDLDDPAGAHTDRTSSNAHASSSAASVAMKSGQRTAPRQLHASVAVGDVVPDRLAAFESYKTGPGTAKASLLAQNKARLKQQRAKAKELGISINGLKREVDSLKAKADTLAAARMAMGGDAAQVLTPEELAALSGLKAAKANYREQYNELTMVKSEVDYTSQLADACQTELLGEFGDWFQETYGEGPPSPRSPAGSEPPSPSSSTHSAASNGFGSGSGRDASRSLQQQPQLVPVQRQAAPIMSGGKMNGQSPTRALQPPQAVGVMATPPKARKVLASLVAPEEAGDADALSYYAAQSVLLSKAGPHILHKPGSAKKHRAPPSFGTTGRAAINEKVSTDISVAMHPGRPHD